MFGHSIVLHYTLNFFIVATQVSTQTSLSRKKIYRKIENKNKKRDAIYLAREKPLDQVQQLG